MLFLPCCMIKDADCYSPKDVVVVATTTIINNNNSSLVDTCTCLLSSFPTSTIRLQYMITIWWDIGLNIAYKPIWIYCQTALWRQALHESFTCPWYPAMLLHQQVVVVVPCVDKSLDEVNMCWKHPLRWSSHPTAQVKFPKKR